MSELKDVQDFVSTRFVHFGINKQQEIIRLIYEIAKREQCCFDDVIPEKLKNERSFPALKRYLLKRRFPNFSPQERESFHLLSKLKLDPDARVNVYPTLDINPKTFYIEKAVQESSLVQRLKKKFPRTNCVLIPSYKEYIADKKYSLADYNNRLDQFFIVRQDYDHLMPCPCSAASLGCGYHILNIGQGCVFECTYCYLQGYINSPGIVLPSNIEDFFDAFRKLEIKPGRVGSGQFTDSLVFDHLTEFSPLIVDFFRGYPQVQFEFKTKSKNIENLLGIPSAGNIVVGWSLNPQKIIDTTELYAASLSERLSAAQQCARAGYQVAFHFDPIVFYDGWEQDYQELVEQLFSSVEARQIAWISLGALRMTPALKKTIETRFPENKILDGELLPGYDGKFRYSKELRKNIYSKMGGWLRSFSPGGHVYLCMEEEEVVLSCKKSRII